MLYIVRKYPSCFSGEIEFIQREKCHGVVYVPKINEMEINGSQIKHAINSGHQAQRVCVCFPFSYTFRLELP